MELSLRKQSHLVSVLDAAHTTVLHVIRHVSWSSVGIDVEEAHVWGSLLGKEQMPLTTLVSYGQVPGPGYISASHEIELVPFLQVLGFGMFAASVPNFVVQLYTLPEIHAKEILNMSANLMLGRRAWLKGSGTHPDFRARVDVGMKAVLRCPISQIQTILNLCTRHSLLSAGSRVAVIHRALKRPSTRGINGFESAHNWRVSCQHTLVKILVGQCSFQYGR